MDGMLGWDGMGLNGKGVAGLRFAGLVAVVGFTGLAWGDGGVVDEFEKVLAEASDDGELLAVLAESIELVGKSRLELLAGDV